MRKLVIVPAYNEQDNILKTIEDIKNNAPDFDYIVINDCSKDETLKICIEHNIKCLNLPVNLGIGGAVQTGYLYGIRNNYDIAVQFDGDGQHSAIYLKDMLELLNDQKADMVVGSRFIRKEGFQSSLLRRLGIKHFSLLIKILTKTNITDPTSGMRMVNKNIMKLYSEDYPKDYPEPESLVYILSQSKKVVEIPVIMNRRDQGTSSISASKSVYYMIKVTIAMIIARLRK